MGENWQNWKQTHSVYFKAYFHFLCSKKSL